MIKQIRYFGAQGCYFVEQNWSFGTIPSPLHSPNGHATARFS